jgi:hypothetical protein
MGFAAEAVFLEGGERGRFAPKKGCNAPSWATDFREKKFFASSIRIVSYCKFDMYFNKYDMYSIVGIDKKTYGEGIGITYIHT